MVDGATEQEAIDKAEEILSWVGVRNPDITINDNDADALEVRDESANLYLQFRTLTGSLRVDVEQSLYPTQGILMPAAQHILANATTCEIGNTTTPFNKMVARNYHLAGAAGTKAGDRHPTDRWCGSDPVGRKGFHLSGRGG